MQVIRRISTTLPLFAVILLVLTSCASTPPQASDNPQGAKSINANQITVTFLLSMSKAKAWSILQDYSLPHNYVPGLTKTEIVSENNNGLGAHRQVYKGDDYSDETIIEWSEGQGFLMKLHSGEKPLAPFEFAQFRYALNSDEDEMTRVVLSLYYELPWWDMGGLLNWMLIESAITESLIDVGAGMKYFYQTNEPANDENREKYLEFIGVVDTR